MSRCDFSLVNIAMAGDILSNSATVFLVARGQRCLLSRLRCIVEPHNRESSCCMHEWCPSWEVSLSRVHFWTHSMGYSHLFMHPGFSGEILFLAPLEYTVLEIRIMRKEGLAAKFVLKLLLAVSLAKEGSWEKFYLPWMSQKAVATLAHSEDSSGYNRPSVWY